MTRSELFKAVAAKCGCTRDTAEDILTAFTEIVGETLKSGDKVNYTGFGTFSVKESKERQGINPATKEAITIPAKKVAKFKPATDLTNKIK